MAQREALTSADKDNLAKAKAKQVEYEAKATGFVARKNPDKGTLVKEDENFAVYERTSINSKAKDGSFEPEFNIVNKADGSERSMRAMFSGVKAKPIQALQLAQGKTVTINEAEYTPLVRNDDVKLRQSRKRMTQKKTDDNTGEVIPSEVFGFALSTFEKGADGKPVNVPMRFISSIPIQPIDGGDPTEKLTLSCEDCWALYDAGLEGKVVLDGGAIEIEMKRTYKKSEELKTRPGEMHDVRYVEVCAYAMDLTEKVDQDAVIDEDVPEDAEVGPIEDTASKRKAGRKV